MRPLLLLVIVAGLPAVGCVPLPQYRVQRSARVPRPAVPLRTGEPLAGPVELSVGDTAGSTARLTDKSAAIEVPQHQVRGELRIRIRERGEIAPFYEQAVESSIDALDPTQAPVKDGAPHAIGLATRYAIPSGMPELSFGLAFDMMSFSIPYVEYRTCVKYCEENGVSGTEMYTGTESVGSFGIGLTPTYRTGRVALFAGGYARRHPSIERKGSEIGAESDQDITGGNYNFMLHAGVEVRASVFSFLASVQQDLTTDPVRYGPSLGIAIALHAPELRRTVPSRPPSEPAPSVLPSGPPGTVAGLPPEDDELPDDPW